jgi:hypothetical protein
MVKMFRLMQKFSISFAFYTLVAVAMVFPLFNHDRLTGPDPLTLNFVFTLAPYLFFVVLGAVYIHEQMEQKTNGYSFLRILPVQASDIVVSKFLLVFLTTLIYVGFHCAAFAKISPDPSYFIPSCSFLIINANICLVLTALLYVGIFRYGNSRVCKFIVFLWIFIVIAPIPINIFLLKRLGITRQEIIQKVIGLNWVIVTFVCVAVFFLLMYMAIKTLKNHWFYGV